MHQVCFNVGAQALSLVPITSSYGFSLPAVMFQRRYPSFFLGAHHFVVWMFTVCSNVFFADVRAGRAENYIVESVLFSSRLLQHELSQCRKCGKRVLKFIVKFVIRASSFIWSEWCRWKRQIKIDWRFQILLPAISITDTRLLVISAQTDVDDLPSTQRLMFTYDLYEL